jgi:hypothetical protein
LKDCLDGLLGVLYYDAGHFGLELTSGVGFVDAFWAQLVWEFGEHVFRQVPGT